MADRYINLSDSESHPWPVKDRNCHRFHLEREWIGAERKTLNWIMLNPSTADERFDDPTIRKCCGFAKRWGFTRITVTNLFAFRATDPKDMLAMLRTDPARAMGANNDGEISHAAGCADLTVAAWGAHKWAAKRA